MIIKEGIKNISNKAKQLIDKLLINQAMMEDPLDEQVVYFVTIHVNAVSKAHCECQQLELENT